jgi:hypothetical protein
MSTGIERGGKMSMRVQHKYDYHPSQDAFDSTTRTPSPLMGEDKGEGDLSRRKRKSAAKPKQALKDTGD